MMQFTGHLGIFKNHIIVFNSKKAIRNFDGWFEMVVFLLVLPQNPREWKHPQVLLLFYHYSHNQLHGHILSGNDVILVGGYSPAFWAFKWKQRKLNLCNNLPKLL